MLSRQASSLPTPAQPGHGSARGVGQRLRHIVEAALRQRRHLVMKGLSQPMPTAMVSLTIWLERNPYPSQNTVMRFPHRDALELVMPHHKSGKAMLAEVRQFMNP